MIPTDLVITLVGALIVISVISIFFCESFCLLIFYIFKKNKKKIKINLIKFSIATLVILVAFHNPKGFVNYIKNFPLSSIAKLGFRPYGSVLLAYGLFLLAKNKQNAKEILIRATILLSASLLIRILTQLLGIF